jgi:hypothetical protein
MKNTPLALVFIALAAIKIIVLETTERKQSAIF